MMEAKILLRNPDIYPSNEVLQDTLGGTIYPILESFFATVTNDEYLLTPDWRFYNDGKVWLCKIVYKKKTILWLSVWEGFFKTSFFFTEKHLDAISALDITETIKKNLSLAKPTGRLIPMIIDVNKKEQLADLLTVVRFKKNLK